MPIAGWDGVKDDGVYAVNNIREGMLAVFALDVVLNKQTLMQSLIGKTGDKIISGEGAASGCKLMLDGLAKQHIQPALGVDRDVKRITKEQRLSSFT